jgi:hypothetical protein
MKARLAAVVFDQPAVAVPSRHWIDSATASISAKFSMPL